MFNNSRGFTFVEAIISFSLIVLIAASFFPLMFRMLSHLHEVKDEMRAYRMLYEYVEEAVVFGDFERKERTWNGIDYEYFISTNEQGERKLCVAYENKQRCVE